LTEEVERAPEEHLLQADAAEWARALTERYRVQVPELRRNEWSTMEMRRMSTTRPTRPSQILGVIAASCATALLLIGAAAALAQPASRFALSWGAAGGAEGALNGPDNLAVDLRGDVYVADRDNNRIQKFASSGRFLAALGRNGGDGTAGLGPGEFNHPRGVTTDGLGDLYVADSASNRIEKFGPDGRFQARFGRSGGDGSAGRARGEFNDPRGLATDPAGNLYVADHGNNRVQKLDSNGRFLAVWGRNGGEGSSGRGAAQFTRPRGVAVDSAGHLFVADKGNNRVQEFGPDGQFMRTWGRNGGDGSFARKRRVQDPVQHCRRPQRPGLCGRHSQQPHPGLHRRRRVPRALWPQRR